MAGYRIIKTCGCGRKYNRRTWKKLPFVGTHHEPKDEFGPEMNIEYRNCPCKSTLAIELRKKPR